MKNQKRYLITSALPYSNGPIHIGHLAGVYVPADIYTRYLRLRKQDAIHICGSDEHGVPITLKAKKEGITPQQVVDRYHKINKKAFSDFGISFDIYSRTSSEAHHKTASEFFKNLYDKGEFIEKTSKQLYDKQADQYLADRYVTGTCPHCGSDSAYGDQCEKCGTSLSALDLINPISAITGNVPVTKATKHWYLPLDKHQPFLEEWILEQHKEWREGVKGQCRSWFKAGLQPRAVSRDLNWGVPLPIKDAEGKVLYVWFDAPIGYITATKELTPDWEKYWKSEDTKMVHFIGKDNIVFHCIIFPAMLKAHGDYILPNNVPANKFLNLENDKISTSRNWAVWLHEYLQEFPGQQDVLRYVLTANAPEAKDNNFTWKDFQTRNNNELVGDLGNFINRILVLTNKYYKGVVPEITELNESDKQVIAKINNLKQDIEKSIENYRFREAMVSVINLSRVGNKYLAETEPWLLIKTNPEQVKTIMNICLQITTNLSTLLDPFLPFTAKKLRTMLNIEMVEWDSLNAKNIIKVGHKINKPSLLFSKIDDKTVEKQREKLANSKKELEKETRKITPQKNIVDFEDFQKLDLRIGTVVSAEKVAKTKKLLKLQVNTGLDTRTVVAGIAESYKPEDIINKQVVILVNLSPRKIRKIESQGMLLMAEDFDGKLSALLPFEEVADGSSIK